MRHLQGSSSSRTSFFPKRFPIRRSTKTNIWFLRLWKVKIYKMLYFQSTKKVKVQRKYFVTLMVHHAFAESNDGANWFDRVVLYSCCSHQTAQVSFVRRELLKRSNIVCSEKSQYQHENWRVIWVFREHLCYSFSNRRVRNANKKIECWT